MGKIAIIEQLKRDNPSANHGEVAIYVDAFFRYQEARNNIDEHGSIVAHPRTGAPIDNPYLKILDAAAKQMMACGRVRDVESIWRQDSEQTGEKEW